jgi:hypothetical protein
MIPSDWLWLALTLIQVLGLGIDLAACGFGYERAVREKAGLIAVLERDRLTAWLALGTALFALGLLLSEANVVQKFAALGLAACLGWIAWRPNR